MGVDSAARDVWAFGRIRELADKLDGPHADKVYVAKEYTKADLRRDLLATLPPLIATK